jgi:protein-L-isoaspartate(D-aspartate) O-methyltransferase
MSVLEVGSGGFNAALLAELAGSGGHVTTVDCRTPLIFTADRDTLKHVLQQVRSTLQQASEQKRPAGAARDEAPPVGGVL